MIRRICQLLWNPTRRRVLMHLDELGARSPSELSAELRIERHIVEYHLRVLRTGGFIDGA